MTTFTPEIGDEVFVIEFGIVGIITGMDGDAWSIEMCDTGRPHTVAFDGIVDPDEIRNESWKGAYEHDIG